MICGACLKEIDYAPETIAFHLDEKCKKFPLLGATYTDCGQVFLVSCGAVFSFTAIPNTSVWRFTNIDSDQYRYFATIPAS